MAGHRDGEVRLKQHLWEELQLAFDKVKSGSSPHYASLKTIELIRNNIDMNANKPPSIDRLDTAQQESLENTYEEEI